jgi:hypothetical protein
MRCTRSGINSEVKLVDITPSLSRKLAGREKRGVWMDNSLRSFLRKLVYLVKPKNKYAIAMLSQ